MSLNYNNLKFNPSTANKLCPGIIDDVMKHVPQGGSAARNYCENVSCPNLCNQRKFPCSTCQELPFSTAFEPVYYPETLRPGYFPETLRPVYPSQPVNYLEKLRPGYFPDTLRPVYPSETTFPPQTTSGPYLSLSKSYPKYNCS